MRARGIANGVVLLLCGAFLTPVATEPAAAATNSVTLNLTCQSSTPIGNIATTQSIDFDANAPDNVQIGSSFDINIVFPAGSVSSSQNGGQAHVDYIHDLSYKIPVPANATYTGSALSGGFNYGTTAPSVTLQGTPTNGNVFYSIPGPIPTDQQFQIPALTLHLTASGNEGSSIRLQLAGTSVTDPGFTTTAHVTSPFNGDAATSCFEPAPKTQWNNTQIVAIDTTPPTITLNTPADGAQYPLGAHVLASYSCTDDALGSGIATCDGDVANGAPIDTSTLGDFTFTVNASDNNSNTATVTHHYSIVPAGNDNVPPQITITAPQNGAVYQQGASVNAAYSCIDNESGVATCVGDVANGAAIDTSTVGARTFTVAATDQAGNPHAVRVGYRVVPPPAQQNFTSGDVTNQIPVACDNQFQTAHKTIPVSVNSAPATAGESTQFSWNVALGADFIPTLDNGTNLVYKWAAPTNGHFVSANLTGAGSEVNGAAIAINGDGTLSLTIASVTDQSTAGVGNDAFTPPPFTAIIATNGVAGTAVNTRLAEFDVTVTVSPLPVSTTSHCTAGDPTFNSRTNPTLTNTTVVDRTPPAITITSPTQGQIVAPGANVPFSYGCTDDHGTPSCAGDLANGAAIDTSVSGSHQLSVTSVDAAGNAAKRWVTYIVDDPTVSVGDANVLEGPGATLDFPITISNASSHAVTINYATADGTAIAPDDYAASSGVVTFNPGDPLTQNISIPVVNDNVWRGTRSLTLTLVSAVHATIGTGTATGTITDDDPPPVAVSSPTVKEGAGAALDFTITMAGDPNSPVEVDYATSDGTATAPKRYTATSGTITFVPGGALVAHVLVPVVNDSVYDETTTTNTQTMFLTTTEPANGAIAGGTGTITDDEAVPPVINIGSATIREGDKGSRGAKLAITLTRASNVKITVRYTTVPGTANTADFTSTTGTATFPAGVVVAFASVPIKGDTLAETDESFIVRLSSPTNALLGHADGTVTISDDDHPTSATPQLSVSDNSLYEGGSKPTALKFTVSLSRLPASKVTVQYALQTGTASAGADFTFKSGTLSFGTTIMSQVVKVTVFGDFKVEPDETFTITLSNITGPATMVKAVGTGTILNDD